ncbi:hypothetical protein [Terrabacter sp. 2RAF25]|uniref:hypothetical protein n=1 Tax=Terrabacter sp. 2RAF25 TaxID=3232998 RepID=UPI003F96BC3F
MVRQPGRSQTGKALGMIGLGVAAMLGVTLGVMHALAPGDAHLVSSPASTPATSSSAPDPARPATMPSDSGVAEVPEGGFGGDAQENAFYDWAARHQIGSLNLTGMDASTGELADAATGYCNLLSDEPTGSGKSVSMTISRQTGATLSASRELLDRSVAAFCPQKARYLV